MWVHTVFSVVLCSQIVHAAVLTDIYTSILSVVPFNPGKTDPQDTWNITLGWKIDPTTAAIGDTFNLLTYDVISFRDFGDWYYGWYLLDGTQIVNCTLSSNAGIVATLRSACTCTIIADLSSYTEILVGYDVFGAVFNDGQRKGNLAKASTWTYGETNTISITASGNTLTYDVDFGKSGATQYSFFNGKVDIVQTVKSPLFCPETGVSSITVVGTVITDGENDGAWDHATPRQQFVYSDDFNDWANPKTETVLSPDYSYDDTNNVMTLVYTGDVPAGNYFWFSGMTFYNTLATIYNTTYEFSGTCQDNTTFSHSQWLAYPEWDTSINNIGFQNATTTSSSSSSSAFSSSSPSSSFSHTIPDEYTTTLINKAGSSETAIVSYWATTDSNGDFATGTTTYLESIPPENTTTLVDSSGSSETAVVSYWATTDSNGDFATGNTTHPETIPAEYTTTFTDAAGSTETGVVSYWATTDSNGDFATGTTTYPETIPSEYTTTFVNSDGSSETGVVSYWPTTDSNGDFATGTTTYPESIPSEYTTTLVDSAGSSETAIVSYWATTDSNGDFATGTTTYPDTIPAEYTTTLVDSAGSSETAIVSYWATTDSNGDFATGTTTYPESIPPENTTTFVTSGTAETGVVSHFSTTVSNGEDTTGSTTSLSSGLTETSVVSSSETMSACDSVTGSASSLCTSVPGKTFALSSDSNGFSVSAFSGYWNSTTLVESGTASASVIATSVITTSSTPLVAVISSSSSSLVFTSLQLTAASSVSAPSPRTTSAWTAISTSTEAISPSSFAANTLVTSVLDVSESKSTETLSTDVVPSSLAVTSADQSTSNDPSTFVAGSTSRSLGEDVPSPTVSAFWTATSSVDSSGSFVSDSTLAVYPSAATYATEVVISTFDNGVAGSAVSALGALLPFIFLL